MIIRSPNVRPGEFAIGDAKRLCNSIGPIAATHKIKKPPLPTAAAMAFRHPSSISKRLANCSSAMILSPNTLSGLILDLHQAQIAQWDHLEVPNEGGQHEAFDRVIGGADNWIRGRKH
jgi:hypothetical protein